MKILKTLGRLTAFGLAMVLAMYLALQLPEIPTTAIPEKTAPTANGDTDRIAQLEAQVASLIQDKAYLTTEVERYRAETSEDCMLVLRYEKLVLPSIFGEAIVIKQAVQEVAVSRKLFESVVPGSRIENSDLYRLMSCGAISETRVIVENKYIR
jgi:hypothetical protein